MGTLSKSGQRLSNFELLRIVSILLIVMHHFCVHVDWPFGQDPIKDLVIYLIGFGGKIGVDAFVLITGYFQCRTRFKSRSLFQVWVEVITYALALLVVFAFINPELITVKLAVRSFFPVIAGLNWFVPAYFALYFLSPFYNLCINKLTCNQLCSILSVGFVVLSVGPFLLDENPLESDLVWLTYIYFLGAYLRVRSEGFYDGTRLNPAKLAASFPRMTLTVSLSVIFISIVVLLYLDAHFDTGYYPLYFADTSSPFSLLAALSLMVLFSRIRLRSKLINEIAVCAFAVYLISDNPIVRKCWGTISNIYYSKTVNIIICALAITVGIYLICAGVEKVRARIFFKLLPMFERRFGLLFDKIDSKLN